MSASQSHPSTDAGPSSPRSPGTLSHLRLTSTKATHYAAPYYLPSWQGGDTTRPLCVTWGTNRAATTRDRTAVSCPMCRTILKLGIRSAEAGRRVLS